MLFADALTALALGLSRGLLFPLHEPGARLVGAAHLALACGTLWVVRHTATGRRALVARIAALSLVASGATRTLVGVPGPGATGPDLLLALGLAAVGTYAYLTSPAVRRLHSESPTSRA